ncbi:MAG: dihydropteroate synthase [Flavobacteriaceae bacterium]|nr:dihydropteroate synthase [Flavobacteriaceae bacterium]
MGILNLSRDSFYDGGKYSSKDKALKQTEKMFNEGADIIDIGAFTSKPGSVLLSAEKEKQILFPILEALTNEFPESFFSIDTFRSEIAKISIEIGASIINDISGGKFDKKMFEVIAKNKVPYVMMHMKGTPMTMQLNPEYKNVVIDVLNFFVKQVKIAQDIGVTDIIIDPGFGFGKSLDHNFELLKGLNLFKKISCPILIGLSRKSMIYNILNGNPNKSLNGTTILNTFALINGANIIRVHDVKEAKECITLCEYLY